MKSFAKATTALATGSTLFALQHHAEAAVIYSGLQNVGISVSHSDPPVTRAVGLGDFRLALDRTTGHFRASVRGSLGGFMVNASNALAKLAAGQLVSAGKAFSGGYHVLVAAGSRESGTWAKSQTGFAGVKFSDGSGNSYLGWIRLEWTDTNTENTQTLTALDWAYNDTPDTSILTGQGIPTVPEPSRALLMLAGAGTMALRRRRAK